MKHPKDVIGSNPQTEAYSCVPWATEIVLLTFEKQLPNPSIQKQTPFGWREAVDILARNGIKATDKNYRDDFGGFERDALACIRAGAYPAVMLTSGLYYSLRAKDFIVTTHAYIAYEEKGELAFLTYEGNSMLRLTVQEFEKVRYEWSGVLAKLSVRNPPGLHTLIPIA